MGVSVCERGSERAVKTWVVLCGLVRDETRTRRSANTTATPRVDGRAHVPFGSGDGSAKRLRRRDTGLGHHIVARVEVLALLRMWSAKHSCGAHAREA